MTLLDQIIALEAAQRRLWERKPPRWMEQVLG